MRISDWSSDVCSSDLHVNGIHRRTAKAIHRRSAELLRKAGEQRCDPRDIIALRGLGIRATKQYILDQERVEPATIDDRPQDERREIVGPAILQPALAREMRSEEHTSELQSLMRISYAVFCLKKKNKKQSI